MTCECRLCQDDRECAADRLARAAVLRAEGRDLDEAADLEEMAAKTLERINSYRSATDAPRGVWSGG